MPPRSAARRVLAIDVGGTRIKAAVVGEGGALRSFEAVPVPARRSFAAVVAAIVAAARAALAGADGGEPRASPPPPPAAPPPPPRPGMPVAICCPGIARDGVVLAAANFPEWDGVPLGAAVAAALGLPADGPLPTVVNDATAALLGELWVGAARGRRDVVMLTLGTGVGFAAASGGRVLRGAQGRVEGGHAIVWPLGRACGCGQRGCLEAYASGAAISGMYRERKGGGGRAARERLDAAAVFRLLEAGDAAAAAVVKEAATALALACVSYARVLDCDAFVIGGGVAMAGEALLAAVEKSFAELTWRIGGGPGASFALAEHREAAGVLGAAAALLGAVAP